MTILDKIGLLQRVILRSCPTNQLADVASEHLSTGPNLISPNIVSHTAKSVTNSPTLSKITT